MIDLSPAQVAEHLQSILDLRNDLKATTFDFREEAPAYIDSTRMYKALNIQDYIRALQLGGYGYSVFFPRPAATLTANNDYPLSVFNSGQKTLLVYSVEVYNVTAAGSVHVLLPGGTPSAYGASPIPAPITNHKGGVGNGPAVTAIYNTATGLTAPITNMVDAAPYGANQTQEVLSNGNVYVVPSKQYFEVWIKVLTASVTFAKIDLVELPF